MAGPRAQAPVCGPNSETIDQAISDRWGGITAKALSAKSPLPVIDGPLAATALQHNLTLVTRSTRDVAITGVSIFNPWTS